jgi:hypothetical protein
LELLMQVLRGDEAAIEYVPHHLEQRADSFEKHHVVGGLFPVEKPIRSGGSSPPPPKFKFQGPELLPGSREAIARSAPDPAPGRARAGGSNVLRGAGTSVAEVGHGQHPASAQDLRQPMGTLDYNRSSLERGSSSKTMPSRPANGHGGTLYQDMDNAYNMSMSASAPDLSALKARLTAVLDSKGSSGSGFAPRSSKPSTAGLDPPSSASTMVPSDKGRRNRMLLAGADTPLTSRSDTSEFLQGNAFSMVNDIVDTCVELEQTRTSLVKTDRSFAAMPPTPRTPSEIWCSQAALAAAASAEAAREAAKCAAAAKAATGRYNYLVDTVMSGRSSIAGRSDVTMRPGQPALPAPATSPSRPPKDVTASPERKPERKLNKKHTGFSDSDEQAEGAKSDSDDQDDGISQDKLENEADHDVQAYEIPLEEEIGLREWVLAVQIMDLDPDEAKNIFEQMCEENNVAFAENRTFPMGDFAEELHIDEDDHEGIVNFVDAIKKARQQIATKTEQGIVGDKATVRAMFDKLVRHMDWQHISAKDCWSCVSKFLSGTTEKQIFSRAEQEVIRSYERKQPKFLEKVKGFMDHPPVLCASGGQVACKQLCVKRIQEIVAECTANGTQFTDPNFDLKAHANSCLYVDKEAPGYDCTVAPPAGYKRLTAIVKKAMASGGGGAMGALGGMFGGMGAKKKPGSKASKPMVFKGEIKAGDVVQGQIGTCFLLGAIGAMASHREKALHKIFIKYDVDVGVYGIRFCVNGEWTYVIVDDWMPVDYNGELMYAKCKDPQEVWVPLLEKAFCKLHTCYEMCDGGEAPEALNCFFGGVTGKIQVKKTHRQNPKKFFKLLKHGRDKGWLLTTSFVAQPGAKAEGAGKCGEDMLPCGLVGGHAYSVLKIAEVNGHQLIQCRNPWGSGEWTGMWSDKNEYGEWTDKIKKAVGFENRDDGKFWMSCEDFVNNSGGVDYARTFGPNWKKVTHYAHFATCAMTATAKRNCNAKGAGALSFKKGDQVVVREMQGEVFWGYKQGAQGSRANTPQLLGFPGRYVKFNERPVLRFDIVATPTPGSKDPVTACIMLMQQNICMQRKFKPHESGLTYKDLNYPGIELIIVHPDGSVAVRKQGRKRCVWGEVEMPGGGQWKVYALCSNGKGAPCSCRTYLKGGTMTFQEVKGCKFSEVAAFFFNDD